MLARAARAAGANFSSAARRAARAPLRAPPMRAEPPAAAAGDAARLASGSAPAGAAPPPPRPVTIAPSRAGTSAAAASAPVICAVAQMTSTADRAANYATVEALAEEARRRGAAVAFFPENFHFLGTSPAASLAAAEPLGGPALGRYRALARRLGLWLSLGGFQEAGPDALRLYNTHVVIDAEGEIAATYRKIHLFDLDLSATGGPVITESAFTAPGDGLAACASPAGVLGLSTCYDLRFPAVYQRLAFDHGADVLLVPSAFTVETGRAHWEPLLRARAIETQCWVVAAAQAGAHNERRRSYGHSMIIDPWGEVVARLEDPEATGIAVAQVDPARLLEVRARMPVAAHRAAAAERVARDAAPPAGRRGV
jgi:predicted amidohydrolase